MRSVFTDMPDIVATYILLHNLCIVNKEGIKNDWIVEVKNKLSGKIDEGEIREGSELWGERAGVVEVKRMKLATGDAPIVDEINDEEK
jgi:hypothetical protein